jgi:hypothetical protein
MVLTYRMIGTREFTTMSIEMSSKRKQNQLEPQEADDENKFWNQNKLKPIL